MSAETVMASNNGRTVVLSFTQAITNSSFKPKPIGRSALSWNIHSERPNG
jgi:hypothetical protein